MANTLSLLNDIKEKVGTNNITKVEIPTYITENLKYNLFDWQKTALQYFLAYENPDNNLILDGNTPTHLLFNMATGTGKTLLMAALILYYYNKGYRHFIFFVNQNNIVGKTEENLLNPSHNKYLFQPNIVIDSKTVKVKKVETFSNNSNDIEILFTSIHKLHNSVYTVKENCVYLEDLQERNIVMLGDEAHHLNADTKKKKDEQIAMDLVTALSDKASEIDVEKSWENTVINKILYKGTYKSTSNSTNVLLEFTATVPKEDAVKEKYCSKIIFSFDLKDFLKAGYTKEINLVSSSFNKQQRILQALLFNWYRYKIALNNGLQHFKPVILFRSKLIEASKNDFVAFKELIRNLSVNDFDFLQDIKEEKTTDGAEIYLKGKSRIIDIKHFIAENKIEWSEIINYFKDHFADRNCIITNSKTGTKTIEKTTEEQEKLLNSLEDKNNPITAIFTVQRLTEGWDVLNLFDIVRLYEGQNEGGSNTKTSVATTSEVQLIGRGVRYFPFTYNDKPFLKRKFDDNLEHEMRVLEEFYYHSDDENRYLSELKNELKSKGYLDSNKKIKIFTLKQEFKDSDFYKTVKLFVNDFALNPNSRKATLDEIKKDFLFEQSIKLISADETKIEMDKDEDTVRYSSKKEDCRTLTIALNDFEKHIVRKAINIITKKDLSIFRFNKLKNELKIESVEDIFQDNFLGNIEIKIICPRNYKNLDNISNKTQLDILVKFFELIEKRICEISNPKIGTDFTTTKFANVFDGVKEKLIEDKEEDKVLEKELVGKDWYVLDSFNGTSEERSLIDFLKDTMENLKDIHDKVYLLRNEEVYTIYDFDKGRGFQPDFLLFLKQKKKSLYYQIFIEPKGDQFKDNAGSFESSKEGWKEKFLSDISEKYGNIKILNIENNDYKLIGLPLYNQKNKIDFSKEYNVLLGVI
jgi:type III restriction enzyme